MLGTGRNANNSERLTVGLAVAMAILCAHNGGLLKRRGGWERRRGSTDSARCDVEKGPWAAFHSCTGDKITWRSEPFAQDDDNGVKG